MIGAGDLRDRLLFQRRAVDGNGDRLGPFATEFEVWAALDYQRGTESAVNQRLESRQPATIIIRDSVSARTITAGWRAVKKFGIGAGETFNITAVSPARERGFLHLMAISGEASG